MRILLVSTDLMIQSRVAAAAAALGLPAPRVQSSAATADDLLDCGLVILDLSTPGIDVGAAVVEFRSWIAEGTAIIAFAPHVHTAKLSAARDAGCTLVLSRGQFDRELEAILKQWQGSADPSR